MPKLFNNYENSNFFDELITKEGLPKESTQTVFKYFNSMELSKLVLKQKELEKAMIQMGITFNVYSEEGGTERIIPIDIIPRIINAKEWTYLKSGLIQRIEALNLFLLDIYGEKKILKDKIIPEHIIYSSKGYLKECEGIRPPKDIFIHITGTDLIRNDSGDFLVLEDNLRCPSGVSYMLQGRELSIQNLSKLISQAGVEPISSYSEKLFDTLKYVSGRDQPTIAVLTPGIYNSAYYEHSFLAQQMGVELVNNYDLVVDGDFLKMRTTKGLQIVDAIYRRLDDIFIDPTVFNPKSMLGIPYLFNVYKKGNIAIANALGTGVADDKVVYAFVPDMIKYYLNQDPILQNVETYLCENPESMNYVLDHISEMVVKEANEAGGYGMLIGPKSTKEQQENFKQLIKANPRNYIAQPTISLSTNPCVFEHGIEGRHVDLRPYILYGQQVHVTPSGLTRVALKKGSLVVNSSQGGGFKDTWVLKN